MSATRWFLSKIVTRTIAEGENVDTVTGPAIDLTRGPDGGPFWPAGTRKRYAYSGNQQGWLLAIVDASEAGYITCPTPDDPDVLALPDIGLDARLSTIAAEPAVYLRDFLASIGVAYTWSSADSYRRLIRALGRVGKPDFDEDVFGEF
jgi:hypothetical protein